MMRKNIILVECIYDDDDKKQFLKTKLGLSAERFETIREYKKNLVWNTRRYMNDTRDIAGKFLNYAPALKHKSFSEEKEWRLVTHNDFDGFMGGQLVFKSKRNDEVLFREGTNTLIPYLEIPLIDSKDEPLCFNGIVISPTPNPQLTKSACELMLNTNGVSISPKSSDIPYRTW